MSGNDDEEFDALLRNYRSLTPEQRDRLVKCVIGRARIHRAAAIRALFRSVVGWFRRRRAVVQLQRLDDRMLKDMGITRGDIESAVRGTDRMRAKQQQRSVPAAVFDARRRPSNPCVPAPLPHHAGRAA